MGYENNEENRRAVRILAYNNLEMTEENIDRIKDLDKSVNLLFKSMTGEKHLNDKGRKESSHNRYQGIM